MISHCVPEAAPRGSSLGAVRAVAAAAGLMLAVGVGCRDTYSGPPALRLWTNDLAFQVSTEPVPPPAREDVIFKVVVRDKNSGKAIESGEGRVYATSADRVNTWDGLTPSQQAGTYTAKLNFLTSGNWAMGMQFRRDSTAPLETLDWTQDVHPASGEANIK
jgi:hypothetical protein